MKSLHRIARQFCDRTESLSYSLRQVRQLDARQSVRPLIQLCNDHHPYPQLLSYEAHVQHQNDYSLHLEANGDLKVYLEGEVSDHIFGLNSLLMLCKKD